VSNIWIGFVFESFLHSCCGWFKFGMCLASVKILELLRLDWEGIIMQNHVLKNYADLLVEE